MPAAPSFASRRLQKPIKKSSTKPQATKENAPTSPESKTQEAIRTESKFQEKVKISSESLAALFTKEKLDDKVQKLVELIRDRIADGRRLSLKDWKVYAAIDEAYNAPFYQITPTLIGKVLDGSGKRKPEEIERDLAAWGLTADNLFIEVPHPTDPTRRVKAINRETFIKILVPIVKSVLNARESKLFNERNNNPFFSYSAQQQTEEKKTVSDIITQVIETMATQYGMKATLRAAIHQALKYSFALMFPSEAWHYEEDYDENGEEYTKKEGMRYNLPHPTRCAYDQNFRPSTFNSDTGCEWALYWRLARFGDVDSNPVYYNKNKVTYGSYWWDAFKVYFDTIYPCVMDHPAKQVGMSGNPAKDRELQAQFYNTNDHDKGVWQTDIFLKLSPKQWGLGDYKPRIWFRFVVANDQTVMYAEPLPYNPVLYLGTDADDSTSNPTASFALECLPWQDLVSNILRQHLVALKQNAVKVIPYDKWQVTEAMLKDIKAQMTNQDSAIFIPFDPREARVAQVDPSRMFPVVQFPQTNTAEIIGTIDRVLTLMERALGLSAQEVGAIAGHIQTAQEIRTVAENQGARLEYIGTFIDDFVDAWKRQLYDASRAFMDEEFVVYVSGVKPEVVAKLKKDYGFEFGDEVEGKVEVRGRKSKLSVDAFISTREGKTRLNQPQIAAVMMQAVQAIASNPLLSQHVKPEDLIKLITRAARLAGLPEDAEIKADPEMSALAEQRRTLEALQDAVKQITQAATQKATQQATETISSSVGPAVQKTAQMASAAVEGVQQTQQGVMTLAEQQQRLEAVVVQLSEALQRIAPPMPPQVPPPMQMAA